MNRIADYDLIRSLGLGSHGEFWLSTPPPRLGLAEEFVAVKVVSGVTGEEAFRRATRELRAFATARSPHLVTLYDAGQDGGRFYYAMEYFPMGSMSRPEPELARQHKRQAMADAARAAHALHEVGVLHRGIKPANVMVTPAGGKLSDLGLAQVLSPGLTVTGLGPIGSVEYLDPAILRGERGSRSSDIWSLGATLHRVLAGVGLFGEIGNDPLVAVRKVLTSPPAISPQLTAAEADIVRSCISTDPAARPKSAEELAGRIDALAAP